MKANLMLGVVSKKISRKIFLLLTAFFLIGGFFVVKMAFADPIFSVTAAVEAVDVGQTKDLTFNVIKATGETALKTIAISEVGTGFSSPTSIVCPTGWSVIPAMPPIVNGYVCNDPTGVGLDSTSITLKGMIAPASAGVKDFSVSAINTGAEPKTENVKTQITVKDLKATATISPITTNIKQERTYTLNLTNNSATPGDDITQVSGTLAGFNITSCSTTSWTTCTPSGDSFILSDGSLAPTNSVDISVIATAPANSGAQTVSAQITGALGGTANATISQNVIQVQTPADLAIGDITSDKVYISKNSGAINSSTVSADITNNGKATANTLVKTLVIKDALGVDISNQFVITEATTTAELLGNETKTLSWIVTANASTSIEALVKAEVSVGYNDINTGVIAITGPATKVNDQIFTVDNTAPVIVSHSDEVVEATGHSGAIVKYTAPSATDNMDTSATISSCTPVSGTTFSIGSTTITCVSSDKAGNVATPAVFVINVVDTTAPVITMKDVSPITLEYGKSYTDAGATALDIVDLSVSVIASGTVNTLILGTYEISYNAVDAHNNHAIQVVRTVNVVKKAITITADAQTKVYGEANLGLTYTIANGSLVGTDTATGTLSRVAGENVGTYAITQNTLTAGDNYNLTYVGANLTISKRAITITATTDTKPYDSTITSTATSTMTSGTLANSETATWTQTFDDKNVGTKTLTPTGSVADGNNGKNYDVTFVNNTGAIAAISAIGSVVVDSKVYDGTTTATIKNRSLSGVISNDTVSYVGGSANFDTENVGIGKIVSISGLTISGADAGNYTVNDTATTTANITTLPITITADTQTKTYGEVDPELTYTFTPALISGDSFGTSTIARAVDENVGTYAITQNGLTAGDNYAITFVGANLTINKKAITITADAQTKVYGEANLGLTYTIANGSLVGTDTATGTLSRVAGENVGTYAITQNTLTAGDNYNLTYVGANLTISKRAITITATTDTKPYDSTITSTATSTMTSGTLANSETATWTQTFDDKNVGTGRTLTPTGSVADGNDGKNYEMTFVNSAGAITAISAIGSVAVDSKVYDGATTATINNRSLSGVISNDTVSYVGGTASFDTKDVGIGKIVSISGLTLFGADAGNYTVNDTATTTANITTLPITITADTQTKTYGEADPILLTYTFTPALISGDSFGTSTIARAVGENVGTYAITQNGLTAGDNYAITFVGANLTINKKAITITADAQTKVYGEANLGLTYTIASGSLVGTDTATGTLSRVAGENVGTYAITQNTLTAGDNYNLTYVGANLTISKRAITITATTDTKPYDSTITSTATSTMTSGTLANSETATWTQTFDDKNVGTKTLTPTGSVADGNNGKNYDVTFVNNTGAIAAISAIGSVVVDSKVYDGTTTATIKNRSLSGVISNDTVSYVGGSANFDTKNVGIGKIVSISGLTISGADAGNYTVNDTATTTANIATLPITITADTQTKTYGEDDPTLLTYTFTPALISGDSFTGVLIRAVGENVGIYAITQNGLTAGTNYVITFVGANLTINPGLATQANIVADYVTAEVSSTTVKLTITVKDVGGNLVADGTTVALTTSLGEVIGLDTTKNGVVSRALTSNTVGNAILTISGLTVSGSTTINFKDTTKPVIVGLTPSKGSSTSNAKPTISAQFTEIGSGINKNKVTLVVDLDDVTEFATITDSGISYVPPFEMSTGFHNVTVNVSDNTGNEASSTWKFAIIDPAVIVAPLSVSQWPVDGTTGVDLNAHPYIQFSKLMNENTLVAGNVEIRLHDAQTTAVSSAIVISTVNNATRVTFIPNSSLTPNVKYFFYIGSGVKDLAVYSLNATWTTANKESHEFTTRALYTNWNISLNQGWNLISLPLIPTNSHISAVLAGISSKVDIAKYYDATTSSWLSYVPGVGGTLTTMEDGKGYWINMKSAGTLNITGVEMPIAEEFPPMYSFVENKWNLIGFKSVVNMTAGDYINGYTKASYNDEILWNYKSGQYSSTNAMESGYGYWLFVK